MEPNTKLYERLEADLFAPLIASNKTKEDRRRFLELLAVFSAKIRRLMFPNDLVGNDAADYASGVSNVVWNVANDLPQGVEALKGAIDQLADDESFSIENVLLVVRLLFPRDNPYAICHGGTSQNYAFQHVVPCAEAIVRPLLERIARAIKDMSVSEQDELWVEYHLPRSPSQVLKMIEEK